MCGRSRPGGDSGGGYYVGGEVEMSECKYRPTERIGLYILVILILMHSCGLDTTLKHIKEKIDRLEIIVQSKR